jgi:hypothetical protein
MKELSAKQLKKLLNTSHLRGTPEQIRMLAIRVGELSELNGRRWVSENASKLLVQWYMVLDRYGQEGNK